LQRNSYIRGHEQRTSYRSGSSRRDRDILTPTLSFATRSVTALAIPVAIRMASLNNFLLFFYTNVITLSPSLLASLGSRRHLGWSERPAGRLSF